MTALSARTSARPQNLGPRDAADVTPVVVLGGGYAGLTAALRLSRSHHITLVDATGTFVERIRLHEAAAGRPLRALPLGELVAGRDITTVTARALAIDVTARTIRLDDGTHLGFRTLVYALGSTTDTAAGARCRRARADGGGRHGPARPALRAQRHGCRRRRWPHRDRTATELAEAAPRWQVRLVTGRHPGAGLSARARRHIAAALERMGVKVHTHTRVTTVHDDHLDTDRGDIPADLVVWAASFTVPALAVASGLAVDTEGRALVDHAMRSVSHPDVFVVGDAAAVTVRGPGRLRMACATAMPSGAHTAEAIEAITRGREPRPFRFRYLGQAVSLGRHDGVFQPTRADDSPHGPVLTGRPAARINEWINRYTLASLRAERRRPGSYRWARPLRKNPSAP
ncbi:FAD-dependent oxidoreductase [Streptomyces sp. NPDC012510]|uniref:NAD(P)/FAD-dependent oxidoreductase n=1 Tax=Streptomyces sp. NPDC012510 TaxID=3364838 RepID=UPI0036ECDCC2